MPFFAKQVTKYPIHSKFASHSLPFTIIPVQIEPQMLVKTRKASLAYQNISKFAQISQSHLSIKSQRQIPTFFSKPHSNTLNNSRAQLTNNKQMLFAQTQPEIQLSSSLSNNLIEKNSTLINNESTSFISTGKINLLPNKKSFAPRIVYRQCNHKYATHILLSFKSKHPTNG